MVFWLTSVRCRNATLLLLCPLICWSMASSMVITIVAVAKRRDSRVGKKIRKSRSSAVKTKIKDGCLKKEKNAEDNAAKTHSTRRNKMRFLSVSSLVTMDESKALGSALLACDWPKGEGPGFDWLKKQKDEVGRGLVQHREADQVRPISQKRVQRLANFPENGTKIV